MIGFLNSNIWYSSSHSESSFEFSPVRLPSARWSCLDSVFFFHFETNFGTSLSEKRSPSSTSTLNRRQTSVTLPVATYDFESPCLTVNCRGTRLSATVRRDRRNCCRLWHLSRERSMNEEMMTSVCREQWWWCQLEKKEGRWDRFMVELFKIQTFWRSVSNDAPIHAPMCLGVRCTSLLSMGQTCPSLTLGQVERLGTSLIQSNQFIQTFN